VVPQLFHPPVQELALFIQALHLTENDQNKTGMV
jgi:hypothetical protein